MKHFLLFLKHIWEDIETAVLIIFICSLGVVLLILARKIPTLNSLPYNAGTGIKKHHIILNTENKIKEILVSFEKQIFLHKILSWIKAKCRETAKSTNIAAFILSTMSLRTIFNQNQ